MLEIKNLHKTYKPKKGPQVKALDGVSLAFAEKGLVFILGKSGSGKSTLLNVIGGLDKADEGEIIIKGKSAKDFSQSDFDSYRNTFIGFIFQEYNILNEFSVGANIALAIELQGKKATTETLNEILNEVDLDGYAARKPNELSGGQKQRVAIARALIKSPEIIMADEPTGALDSNTGKMVFDTLKKLSKNKLIIVVSHDRDFAEQYGDRVIELADGKVISDIIKSVSSPESAASGLQILDNSLIRINKDYTLTEEDMAFIRNYLESRKADTFISSDKKANDEIKRVARLDEDGNREFFSATTQENLGVKDYNATDLKLIKSRLPYKNSFRLGASNLKLKPFRLFMTIFLSAIALALFGLASTMAAYDKVTATLESINDIGVDYVSIRKNVVIENGDSSYSRSALLAKSDVAALKERFPDLEFTALYGGTTGGFNNMAYSFSENINDMSKVSANYGFGSFYASGISGFAEINQSVLDRYGYTLYGRLPQNDNEIVITQYAYEHFEKGGYVDSETDEKITNVTDKNQIISHRISLVVNSNPKNFTITGIVDTHFDSSRYDDLKSAGQNSQEDIINYLTYSELCAVLFNSLHAAAFVNNGYIDKLIGTSVGISPYGSNYNIGLISNEAPTIGNYYYADIFYSESEAQQNAKVFFSDENTSLADNELLISKTCLTGLNVGNGKNLNEEIRKAQIKAVIDYCVQNLSLFDKSSEESNGEYRSRVETLVTDYYKYAPYVDYLFEDTKISMAQFEYNIAKPIATAAEKTYLSNFFSTITLTIEVFNQNNSETTKTPYSIVGYFDSSLLSGNANGTSIIVVKNTDSLNIPVVGDYVSVVAQMPSSNTAKRDIINYTYDDGIEESDYCLMNEVTVTLDQVNSLIESLSKIFVYFGIFFAAFASLLLMNFISISIANKKREIGILRAVGARGIDVLGIFFNESLMISLINLIVSVCFTIITLVCLNGYFRNSLKLVVTILNFGIIQILLMLAISIFVAVIASALPVIRIARKKPIDAIQNR